MVRKGPHYPPVHPRAVHRGQRARAPGISPATSGPGSSDSLVLPSCRDRQ